MGRPVNGNDPPGKGSSPVTSVSLIVRPDLRSRPHLTAETRPALVASSLLSGTNTAAAWYRSGGSHGQGSRGLAKHPPAVRRRRGGRGDTGIVGTDGRRDVQRRQAGEVEIRPQLLASCGERGVVQSFQLIRARSNDLRLRFCASCRLGVFPPRSVLLAGPKFATRSTQSILEACRQRAAWTALYFLPMR